jgi:MFS family permease
MTPPRHRRTIALLLAADFFYWASMYFYMPTLPGLIEARTGSLVAVGLVTSMYGLWQALARIPVGIAVDATGRARFFIILGFVLAAMGAVVLYVGQSTLVLAFGRALTGLAAATWVPMVTVYGGLFPLERLVSATSVLAMVGAAGRLFAQLGGGLLNDGAGIAFPYVTAAACGLLAAAAVAGAPLPAAEPRRPTLAGFLRLARRPDVLVPTIAQTFASFASWAVTMSFLPVLAGRLGAGGGAKGLLMGLGTLTSLGGSAIAGVGERRFGAVVWLRAVFVTYCLGIALAAFSSTLAPLFVAAAVMGVANGVYYPSLMSISLRRVAREERATATGIHQAVYAVGMFAGPSVGGMIAERFGIPAMFVFTAVMTLAAAWVLLGVYGRLETTAAVSRPAAR